MYMLDRNHDGRINKFDMLTAFKTLHPEEMAMLPDIPLSQTNHKHKHEQEQQSQQAKQQQYAKQHDQLNHNHDVHYHSDNAKERPQQKIKK